MAEADVVACGLAGTGSGNRGAQGVSTTTGLSGVGVRCEMGMRDRKLLRQAESCSESERSSRGRLELMQTRCRCKSVECELPMRARSAVNAALLSPRAFAAS